MKIVVAGAGAVGSHLAKMLSQENHDIILLDPDESKLRQVGANLDVMTRTGSATSIPELLDTNIKKCDLFIAVAKTEEINITAAILGKRLGAKKTIARIDNQEYLYAKYREHFTELGVDYMIYPEKIAAREITGLLHQTGSTDIADFSGGKLTLVAIKLEEDAPIVGKTLTQIVVDENQPDYRAVAVTREGETIIPKGDFAFNSGDLVYIVTNQKDIDSMMEYSGKKQYDVRNIMILGGSRIGALTAKDLGTHHNIKLIERDREKSYRLSNMLNNALVINGDGRDYNLLMEEGLNKMDAFIAVTGDSETNILSCMLSFSYGQNIERKEQELFKKHNVRTRTSWDYKFTDGKFNLNGKKSTLSKYDNNGQVLEKQSFKPDGQVAATENFRYDGRGNRIFYERQSTSSEYKKESEYDEIDNIIREAGYDGQAPFKTIYVYNSEDRVSEISYYINSDLEEKRVYTYTGNKAEVKILKRGQLLTSKLELIFNDDDKILEEKYLSKDGVLLEQKKYTYNNGKILSEEKIRGDEMIYRITHAYDGKMNLLSITEESKSKGKFVKKKYSYDELNRITEYQWKRNPDNEYNIKSYKYESSKVCTEEHTFYPKTNYKLLTKYKYEYQ